MQLPDRGRDRDEVRVDLARLEAQPGTAPSIATMRSVHQVAQRLTPGHVKDAPRGGVQR